MAVVLLNPLGKSLGHYCAALEETLSSVGMRCSTVSWTEPRHSSTGRLRWITAYVWHLLRLRVQRTTDPIIVVWPVLGYLDFVLLQLVRGRSPWLVVHDPKPLVRAIGYGRLARWLAGRSWIASRALVHTQLAEDALTGQVELGRIRRVSHPMKSPLYRPGSRTNPHPLISVLGRYKKDRDIDGLRLFASNAPSDWRLEIHGEDWPDVSGWTVRRGFVSENEFERLVERADLILIPYVRFYQSGVAFRALELCTPIVGPRNDAFAQLPEAAPWFSDSYRWHEAALSVLATPSREVLRIAQSLHSRSVADWRTFFERELP